MHPGVPWRCMAKVLARARLRRGEVQARPRSLGRGLSPGQPTTVSVRVVRLSERCDPVCPSRRPERAVRRGMASILSETCGLRARSANLPVTQVKSLGRPTADMSFSDLTSRLT